MGIRFDKRRHDLQGIIAYGGGYTTHTHKIMKSFSEKIAKIGINPYTHVPEAVLVGLFKQAGKMKGPIPVRGTINGKRFKQTLVKYQGAWRLYINGEMRQAAGVDVGDQAYIKIEFDPVPRKEELPSKLIDALSRNKLAKTAFEKLAPSRQKEIIRYLNGMKTETSLERNIEKVIQHLLSRKTEGLHHLLEARD